MSSLLNIKIIPTNPSPDVVTLQEAKDYCRVDFNSDDALFNRLIASSRQQLEHYTCRVFLAADCEALYTQQGCGNRIILSYSDNIELTGDSVSYADSLVGESYIDTEDRKVELTYTAGYAAASVPEWMKMSVLMQIAYRYENRGDVATSMNQISTEAKAAVAPFVNWSLL